MTYTFEYSKRFRDIIIDMHRESERLPFHEGYIKAHLGGPDSNLSKFIREICPEIAHHCGDISSKRVLDFGCGTGATTAALAMICSDVVAFDIDERSVSICRERLREHGLSGRVEVLCAPDFGEVIDKAGEFDFILVNAVLEHIPLSRRGLRRRILRMLFDILKVKGYMYISGTPNRLWPIDGHTTGLWWIPWTKPGSRRAYSKAIRAGRHFENLGNRSKGPLGLEERGAWGATFFEIRGYLRGKRYEIVNLLPGHDKHLSYTRHTENIQRRIFDFLIYYLFTKWAKIPMTALAPGIENLAIRKVGK
ncbi:MAG: methyltransferase domain-containing protein [Candidatus Aenigmarchaeota archaeon]|nr:methyltransferase domain-containing protein [Candidatus Aenigmarchaeota archaeon]